MHSERSYSEIGLPGIPEVAYIVLRYSVFFKENQTQQEKSLLSIGLIVPLIHIMKVNLNNNFCTYTKSRIHIFNFFSRNRNTFY